MRTPAPGSAGAQRHTLRGLGAGTRRCQATAKTVPGPKAESLPPASTAWGASQVPGVDQLQADV
jgi:hypothetical protein